MENFYGKNKSLLFRGKDFSSKSSISMSNRIAQVAEKRLKCNTLMNVGIILQKIVLSEKHCLEQKFLIFL